MDGLELPSADDADHRRSWFVYVVLFPDSAAREHAIAAFEREAIGYNRYLPSIHLQPYMRERFGFQEGLCPVAGGRQLALARASVLHGDRGGRAGARRRGSRVRAVNLQRLDRVEPFTTKDGSTIRELHHTSVQSLAEASLEPVRRPSATTTGRTEEIYLVTRARARWRSTASARRVRPGDAILISPGVWHTLENDGTSELTILCMCSPPYSDEDTFFDSVAARAMIRA